MSVTSLRTSPLHLTDEDRATLQGWSRAPSSPSGLALRARIVLALADGQRTSQICDRLRVSRPTVSRWRQRYLAEGLEGLHDAARSGRPKTVDDARIIAATREPPPERLGVTRWSTRLLAAELGVSDATVARAWRKHGLQPWRRKARTPDAAGA